MSTSNIVVATTAAEDEDEGQASINLLDIPPIWSTIKNKLGAEGLKNIRLVNKYFMEDTFELWRSTATLIINSAANIDDDNAHHPYSYRKVPKGGIRFEDLFVTTSPKTRELMQQSGGKNLECWNDIEILPQFVENPFQKHKIISSIELPPNSEEWGALCRGAPWEEIYWVKYGPHLTSLHLESVTFYWLKSIKGMDYLFRHCPNLKDLKIENDKELQYGHSGCSCCAHLEYGNEEIIPFVHEKLEQFTLGGSNDLFEYPTVELWRKVFSMFPNLKSLKLEKWEPNFLVALSLPSASGTFLKLEFIFLEEDWRLDLGELQHLLNYLQVAQPPLKILKVRVDSEKLQNNPQMQQLLDSFKEFTEKLDLTFEDRYGTRSDSE